jgi:hypothetical protein
MHLVEKIIRHYDQFTKIGRINIAETFLLFTHSLISLIVNGGINRELFRELKEVSIFHNLEDLIFEMRPVELMSSRIL